MPIRPALRVTVLLLCAMPAAADAARPVAARIDAAIARYYRADGPGATVIVTRHGKPVFRKAYGLASVAPRRPMTPAMVQRLASVTKQFTAAAILLLADEGRLALDDDITAYLPDYPAHDRKITIEHLLTHTSGIPSYTGIAGFADARRDDVTVQQMIARFKDLPLEFAPGTRYRYNNSGYFLLGAIIEQVAGQPYADFMAQRLFIPLGMQDTAYAGHERRQAPHAAGHTRGADGWAPSFALSMTQPYAAGALVSTVDDLARWDGAIAAGKLLKRATWQRAFTAYRLADGTSTHYGYGWSVAEWNGSPAFSHGGGIDGFATYVMRLPEQGIYVAVLQNADGLPASPDVPARKAAAIAAGKPYPEHRIVRLAPAALAGLPGTYGSGGKSTHTVRQDGADLLLQREIGPARRLLPFSPTGFAVENTLVTVKFTRGADGAATALVIDDTAKLIPLERIR